MHPKWYITPSHAAAILGCHQRDVFRLIDARELEFIVMPGGKVKVSRDGVRELAGAGIGEREAG